MLEGGTDAINEVRVRTSRLTSVNVVFCKFHRLTKGQEGNCNQETYFNAMMTYKLGKPNLIWKAGLESVLEGKIYLLEKISAENKTYNA